ncbi:sigma factor [Paenibacillus thermoaerophilus]|uniref:Sigma factor n=1 Tax=Paenibacillus thermoaerophilus TaxID=1215385 RepID=A0ABW2V1H0_9BACL|nr:sigma factor [Paenibacillus thermoaerophilus]TMV18521.1 hypothetical protein FE781_03675 [Paenibacillus thermoaerophilus]
MNCTTVTHRRHIGDLRRYLYSLSGDPHAAEDLVQEVFYKACKYLDS